MEILDRIKSLEGKVDSLSLRSAFAPETYTPMSNIATTTDPMSTSPAIVDGMSAASFQPSNNMHSMPPPSSTSASNDDHYIYVSAATQMMGWPAMQQLLEPIKDKVPGLNPSTIESDGPNIVLGTHEHNEREPLTAHASEGQSKTGGALSINTPDGAPMTVAALTWDTMQTLSKAYFDSLNFLFPLVDRRVFLSETLPALVHDGLSESTASTIALLVFALGELVISGSQGTPIKVRNGRPSGIRGGTAREPPGLPLFNEARKRMGFNSTECSIENIQIFALAG